MAATEIVGRQEELDGIEQFLARIADGPAALVLSGEAGIGKTILWEEGVEEADRQSGSVLTCRGIEAEASLSFAGLSELLAPVFEEVADTLLPPRRRALEVALLIVEPGDAAPDVHAIGLAVLDGCALSRWPGPFSSRSTICSGSIRHRRTSSRSRSDVCATSRYDCSQP